MPVFKINGVGARLERGDLRLLVLDLLRRPMHGYQILCELRAQSKGGYNPSTGALYPQLKSLEEEGLIKIEDREGKKVYIVTKSGEEYLKKNKKLVLETNKRFAEFWNKNEIDSLVGNIRDLARVIMDGTVKAIDSGDPKAEKKLAESKEILKGAERELRSLWT